MSHTPGPWTARRDGRHTFSVTVGDHETGLKDVATSMRVADARLTAAAPEMLEALESLVEMFDPDKQSIYSHARKQIERAKQTLAKAKGES